MKDKKPVHATVASYLHLKAFLAAEYKTAPEDEHKAILAKYTRIVWWAKKHGSFSTCIPAGGVGQTQYQMDGSRIVAIIGLKDLAQLGKSSEELSLGDGTVASMIQIQVSSSSCIFAIFGFEYVKDIDKVTADPIPSFLFQHVQ